MFWEDYELINPFRSNTPRRFYDPVKGHTGIDIATPEGTPISLHIATTVAKVATQQEMGKTLYLRDYDGNILVFSHLNAILYDEGDKVLAGQTFADSGNTGSATTGPHLHFEVISQTPEDPVMTRTLFEFSGYNIDPMKYLNGLDKGHWSDDAMEWAMRHGVVTAKHDPAHPVTWGEHVVTLERLAKKVLEWTRNPSDDAAKTTETDES